MSLHAHFAELRSLVQRPWDRTTFQSLMWRALHAEREHPEAFASQVLPYLRAHLERAYQDTPTQPTWSLEQWGWSVLDPFTCFHELLTQLLAQGSSLLTLVRDVHGIRRDDAGLRAALGRRQLSGLRDLAVHQMTDGPQLGESLTPQGLPWLRSLRLSEVQGLTPQVWPARDALVSQLVALGVWSLPELERELILSAPLGRLRHVSLSADHLDEDMLRALTTRQELQSLESLGLSWALMPTSTLTSLARLPALPALRGLDMISCELEAEQLGLLACWPGVTQLQGLMLALNKLSDEALYRIALDPAFARVRHLDLSSNELTLAQLEPAHVIGLTRHQTLHLWGNELNVSALATLGQQTWPALHTLDLGLSSYHEDHVRALFARGPSAWPALHTLDLSKNKLGDRGALWVLGQLPDSLRVLKLADNGLSPDGQAALCAHPLAAQLQTLELCSPKPEAS